MKRFAICLIFTPLLIPIVGFAFFGAQDAPKPATFLTPADVEYLDALFARRAGEAPVAPLTLKLPVTRVQKLLRDRAYFPPKKRDEKGNRTAWFNHLVTVEVPGAKIGDEVEVDAFIAIAGYRFHGSCFCPVEATVHDSATVHYDDPKQLAAYRMTGVLFDWPYSGENIQNTWGPDPKVAGPKYFTRPHRRSSDSGWLTVTKTPVFVHLWLALSSDDSNKPSDVGLPPEKQTSAFLEVFHTGGQSLVVVKHYRRQ